MALKQDGVYFVLCPKQSNKIEGDILSRLRILGFFRPKQGSGFQTLSGSPIPKYLSTSNPPSWALNSLRPG